MDDLSLWHELKKTITPLAGKGVHWLAKKDIPPRLRVRRISTPILSYALNLHGYTIAEAYEATKKFFIHHQNMGSKKITIITGKGLKQIGAIKKEIPLWFETPFFREKIISFSWKNDGGALDIILKRIKK